MNKKLLSILTIALVTFFSSCGKYEDGPFLSLRTKNGRLTGEWKLVKMESKNTWNGGSSSTTSNFDGTTMTEAYTDDLGSNTTSYPYSETWEIDADKNSVKINQTASGIVNTITSIWNWENGASKKEMINIDGDIYRILRLTGKEMELESVYTQSNGYSDTAKLSFEKN